MVLFSHSVLRASRRPGSRNERRRRRARRTKPWQGLQPLENRVLLATFLVDLGGGGDFTSIQAAINASTGDDVININPGLYNESIDLSQRAASAAGFGTLTINGLGGDDTFTIAPPTGSGIFNTTGFNGTLVINNATISGNDSGIVLDGVSGGFTFNNVNVSTVNTGVNLANNSGTYQFSGLQVTASAGSGLIINNGGTVNVTGGGNMINATGGAGVDVSDSALNMNFDHVTSIDSPTTGIRLNTVTGSFGLAGGTIQNPAGDGVSLQDVHDFIGTLHDVNITGPGGYGAGFDIDGDGDVDLQDFRIFQAQLGGLNISGNAGDDTVTINVTNSTISNSLAGPGVTVQASFGGTVNITNSKISDNTSPLPGAGIRTFGRLNLFDNVITDNTTGNGVQGGGIFNSGHLAINNSSVVSNTSGSAGGGIFNSGGTLIISNSTISNNQTSLGNGGGIFNNGGTVTINNSTIAGNQTILGNGGGIFNGNGGGLTITNSTLTGNQAGSANGGGLFVQNSFVTLMQNTISGNMAALCGGGVSVGVGSGVEIFHGTIVNNMSGSGPGGGIFVDTGGTGLIASSVIAQNTFSGGGPGQDVSGEGIGSAGFNFIGDADGTNLGGAASAGDQLGSSSGAGVINPLLGPLGFNGGPTLNHLPLPGSPLIDVGLPGTLLLDQRGLSREIDIPGVPNGPTAADIGATELGAIEFDQFPMSFALLTLDVPGTGLVSVPMTGPMQMKVFFDGAAEGDAQDSDGNGRDDVRTEMIELTLSGQHPMLGPVQLMLQQDRPTLGMMEEQTNQTPGTLDVAPFAAGDFFVDSFFDVFFEVSLPNLGASFHNVAPLRLTSIFDFKPPGLGDVFVFDGSVNPVPLVDSEGNDSGKRVVGIEHYPDPDAGSVRGLKFLDVNINGQFDPPLLIAPDVVTLPPQGATWTPTREELMKIIDGLPPGTEIQIDPSLRHLLTDDTTPGGSLGGEAGTHQGEIELPMNGTGDLEGFTRDITLPVTFEIHTGPRDPAEPVQSFPTDLFRLEGQLPPGDPDFDLLRITAGTDFGLPSPGHTTLQQLPDGNWAVDSFFDITYRIDFVGAPGGNLAGMAGSTTSTIRVGTVGPTIDVPQPNVTFELHGDSDGDGTPDVLFAQSDLDGFFSFVNLFPGIYQLIEQVPAGSVATTETQRQLLVMPGMDLVPFPDQETGQGSTNVVGHQLVFGNFLQVGSEVISGSVFHDVNGDGIQGGPLAEPGVNGVTIELLRADTNEVVRTLVTAAEQGIVQPGLLTVGADAGGLPLVRIFDGHDPAQDPLGTLPAFDSGFSGGVRVATGDVNGDGMADIIVGAGAGSGPHVKVFSGATGEEIVSFFAFAPSFTGGVYVAAGDVNGDGRADIIVGAGAGGAPQVSVFSWQNLDQPLLDFLAYDSGFLGGVRVAAGDFNGDGFADIVTGAGPGSAPHVKVFDGRDPLQDPLASFFAFDAQFQGGVFVATGDLTGDGNPDLITGMDAGGTPLVSVFDGQNPAEIVKSFLAFDGEFTHGVRVAAGDVNGDGVDDIIVGAGPGATPHVRVFSGATGDEITSFFAFDLDFTGGVYVAAVSEVTGTIDGRFSFTDLPAGDYVVRLVAPDGFEQSFPPNGADHSVNLGTGAAMTGVTFGIRESIAPPPAISGFKFVDRNANGVHDDGEPGLAGVTIFLDTNRNGKLDGNEVSTVTDENGFYSFDVPPGRYTVTELVPDGYIQSLPGAADNGRYTVNVVEGEQIGDLNFGNYQLVTISGVKFEDLNGNGVRDEGEPPLAGVTIFIDRNGNGKLDRGEEQVKTGVNGQYQLQTAPGSFVVMEVVPKGFVGTLGAEGYAVSGESGDIIANRDFGNSRPAIISGVKFEDRNGNGILDRGEKGLRGVTVFLDLNGNGILDDNEPFVLTDAKGRYKFTVAPGVYDVREILPEGYEQSAPGDFFYQGVVVVSGQTRDDLNFGNFQRGSIVGLKFDDLNGNGKINRNEPGLAGVAVRLFAVDTAGAIGDELAATFTDGDGLFEFLNLTPGVYFVREDVPEGSVRTTPQGDGFFVLVTSGDRIGKDVARKKLQFGNVTPALLSGVKFEDMNGNGVFDDGDLPLAGVVVFLDRNRNGRLDDGEQFVLTDENGRYEFRVAPGNHTVAEVIPEGYVQSLPGTKQGDYRLKVVSSDVFDDLDFGNYRPVRITGFKFEDLNGNGVFDEGEPFLKNVTIFVDRNGNGKMDKGEERVKTAEDGSFDLQVRPGAFRLVEVLKKGFVQTLPLDPAEYDFVAESGDVLGPLDFGNVAAATISGVKFHDLNGNGERDRGEPGIEGVTIFVDRNGNGDLDPGEPFAVTDRNGAYSLLSPPGVYDIRELVPQGMTPTAPTQGVHLSRELFSRQKLREVNFGNELAEEEDGGLLSALSDPQSTLHLVDLDDDDAWTP